ncbi:hypothetical protein HPB50_000075 [Hyalomma asiaticum]|uniref:Uncharacterized protein n=1 Tax=Hyalomma asiaticum TaxID=266040 RepID=A0ACB7T019_HYAAI|nr:hypothetical protein HPB50_000075 [Hyalomma asiaticum]
MVLSKCILTTSDKFNYLRFFLKGDAASAIQELPSVLPIDPIALRKLYDLVVINIRELETPGTVGISDAVNTESKLSPVMKQLEETTSLRNGRYEVTLLWKEEVEVSDSRRISIRRPRKLLSRLSSKQGHLEVYDSTIRKYLELGPLKLLTGHP